MSKKVFIVPHDFTSVGDIALEHAIASARPLSAAVHLLHVVSKDVQIKEAAEKLESVIARYAAEGVEIIPVVRIGSIFEDIGEYAAEHSAELIFMGTHGAHGWQHITGSHALKVVTSSTVPFIIVQEKSVKPTGYDSIVVPMDLHKETKQKLSIVASLAKYFKSKVHVVTPDESDEYLRHQVHSNIIFSERFFKERGVEMTSAIVSSSGFDKEVVKYAVSVDADLIAIMNLNRSSFLNAITANYEQYIITNDALIPTLILNPIDTASSQSGSFSMFSV
ncbi:MAG: universal stress protein [Bacteroidota bacterium]|nr:universal stress protein [Bacteroidota bacterium]